MSPTKTPVTLAAIDFYDVRGRTGDQVRDDLIRMIGAIDAAQELGRRVLICEIRDECDVVTGFSVAASPDPEKEHEATDTFDDEPKPITVQRPASEGRSDA